MGVLKTFGLVVPPATGSKFEGHAEALLADNADLGRIICPPREAWHAASVPRRDGVLFHQRAVEDPATPAARRATLGTKRVVREAGAG